MADTDGNKWYGLSGTDVELLRRLIDDVQGQRAGHRQPYLDLGDHQAPEVYIARTPDEVPGVDQGEYQGTGNLTGTGNSPTSDDVPSYADCVIYRMVGDDDDPRLEPIDGMVHRVFNISIDVLPVSTWLIITRDKFGTWWANYGTPPVLKGKLADALVHIDDPTQIASVLMTIWAYNGFQETYTGYTVRVYDWMLRTGDVIPTGERVAAFYCPRSRRYYAIPPSNDNILVQLMTKTYPSADGCPEYTAFRVSDAGEDCEYAEPGPYPGGNCLTVYHEQGIDLVVYPPPSPRKGVPLEAENEAGTGIASWEGDDEARLASVTIPSGMQSQYRLYQNFCLKVPESVSGSCGTGTGTVGDVSVVSSISVIVTARADGDMVADCEVKLVVADVITGTSRHTSTNLTTSDVAYTFSGTPAQWGVDSSPATFNDVDFGCVLRYVNNAGVERTVNVTRVEINVHFSPAGAIVPECIVRVRRSPNGDWWLTDHEPRNEDVRPDPALGTYTSDGVTYKLGYLLRYDQSSKTNEERKLVLIRDITEP